MRRKLVAAALAAGLFAVAGCGDDDDGGSASTEEVCAQIDEAVEPLTDEFNEAVGAAGTAAATEDEAALAEAMIQLDQVVDEVTTALRDGAADAEDEDFSEALEEYAGEIEDLVDTVVAGEVPDMASQEEASQRVEEHCNT